MLYEGEGTKRHRLLPMGGRRNLYIVPIFCAQKAWGIFGMKSSCDLLNMQRNPLAS